MAIAFFIQFYFNYCIFSDPPRFDKQEMMNWETEGQQALFSSQSPEGSKPGPLVPASLFATPLKPAGVLYLRISIKISNLNFQHKRQKRERAGERIEEREYENLIREGEHGSFLENLNLE